MTDDASRRDDPDISERKTDHLELTAKKEVEARDKTNLVENVEFFHDSLPELSVDDVDLGGEFLGKPIDAPLSISGMTGGAERARKINQILAEVAQKLGLVFGVGSQRAMLEDPSLADTYRVRNVAPDVPLLGNVGAVQTTEYPADRIAEVVDMIDADGLAVHMNPGQELMQPEGDRDFRGCLDAIDQLTDELDVPVILKETGCGLSPTALDKIADTGVEWVDTSGAGGTTWIGVETLRTPAEERTVGDIFWDWGTPTAPSVVYAKRRDFDVIASGGLRSGLDAAKAIALGADLAGMALPWLRAAYEKGFDAAMEFGETTVEALRTACVLTGSETVDELRETHVKLGSDLREWLESDSA